MKEQKRKFPGKYGDLTDEAFWNTFRDSKGILTLDFSHKVGVFVMKAIFERYKKQIGVENVNSINEFLRSRENVLLKPNWRNRGYYKKLEEMFAVFVYSGDCAHHTKESFLTKRKIRQSLNVVHVRQFGTGIRDSLSKAMTLSGHIKNIVFDALDRFLGFQTRASNSTYSMM